MNEIAGNGKNDINEEILGGILDGIPRGIYDGIVVGNPGDISKEILE